MATGYDPSAANEYNQLIQQGLTPAEAAQLAGITPEDLGNYSEVNGQLTENEGPPTQDTDVGPQPGYGTTYDPFGNVVPVSPPTQDTAVNPASDPSQFPAYDDEGNLQPGFAVNNETGDTYYQGFDRSYDAPVDPTEDPFEQSRLDAEESYNAQEAYDFSAADINDPYYGLTPNQLQQLGSADPTDPYIRARLGIPQLGGSTLNAGGFAALQPTGVPLIDNAVAAISSFASSLSSFFGVTTKPAVTTQGTTTGAPPPAVIDTKAVASDATAVKEQNPNLAAAATENLTNIQEANVNTVRAEENIDINNRAILDNEQAQAQALEQQRQAQAYIDQNNAELADENLPDDRRAQLEANNAEQYANIAENAAVIEEAQTNIDKSTANNEQQANSILENQYVVAENAEAYRINTTGGVDENGDPVNNTANDPEFNDYGAPEYNAETDGPLTNTVVQELTAEETAALLDQAENLPPTTDAAVDAEQDPEIAAADAAVAAPLEADPEATIPEDVDPNVDAELEEPPGTEGEIIDLAEPVDPESDPELLAGEEEEPFTELAEPPDPDATPELEQLAGEEDLGPYTELAEPPTDEPEQLGDPDLEDGEITDLAEPVDPDADPELEQLGDPALREEEETGPEQLSGPPDVDPNADPGVSGGLSDEEQQARQNPGGLSDEELIARQAAAEQAAAKATAINQATQQSRYKQPGNSDWRVRLALAPSSFYLYNVLSAGGSGDQGAGILAPLAASNGVIFPYMPQISTMYRANYEQYDLVHSNFRGVYYKSSRVDDIQIRGTFTAQDTTEAQYLLAVIHFFRSVTKMFYGKDAERGTPPPLVYLSGLGDYQFSKHPCLVSQFSYTLPNDVDYIRATNPNDYGGNLFNRRTPTQASPGGINFAGARRLANALTPSGKPLPFGATPQTPQQNSVVGRVNNTGDFSTYVPTMMEIDIVLVPVQTRSQVSKQFSLKDFANGNLLKGGFW